MCKQNVLSKYIVSHVRIFAEVPMQAIESSIRDICINARKQKFSAYCPKVDRNRFKIWYTFIQYQAKRSNSLYNVI